MEREVKVSKVSDKVWIEFKEYSAVSDVLSLNLKEYEQLKKEIMRLESKTQRKQIKQKPMNRMNRRLNEHWKS